MCVWHEHVLLAGRGTSRWNIFILFGSVGTEQYSEINKTCSLHSVFWGMCACVCVCCGQDERLLLICCGYGIGHFQGFGRKEMVHFQNPVLGLVLFPLTPSLGKLAPHEQYLIPGLVPLLHTHTTTRSSSRQISRRLLCR